MALPKTKDGTWTCKVPVLRNGAWRALVRKSWVTDDRFVRARFVLVGGPTILIAADDLRRACEASKVRSKFFYSLRIELEKGTINGRPVGLQIDA